MCAESPIGKTIADVIPLNNRLHPKEHILGQMQTRPGKVYDETIVQDDVRRLIATKWFAPGGVRIETAISAEGQVTVYVQVIELNSIVQEVVFQGAQHLSPSELIRLTNIRKGSPLNPAFNEAAAQIIQNKYREEGRYYATVTVSEGLKLSDSRVVFNIVEGPKVKVSKVSFMGMRAATPGRLKTQTTISAPLGGMRFISDKFNPVQLEEDKKKLINYYHKLGHLEVRVNEEIIPSNDLSSVSIVFHVDEGPVYTVREIHLEGNKIFPTERLNTLIEITPGGRYDRDLIQQDIARLKGFYGFRGYLVAVDEQWVAVPGKPGYVDVNFTVLEPGARNAGEEPAVKRVANQVPADAPRASGGREPDRVGRIIINGNTVTKDSVILNELRNAGLNSGQILQYPSIEIARLNLFRRGIFDQENPPSVTVRENEFDSIYKDVIVNVNETRTGQFLFGAGLNSNSGINGNIAINERNFDILRVPTSLDDFINGRAFRGAGQELRLEAQPGSQFQRYSVTFREPYLNNSQYGFTASGYYYNRSFAEYDEDRLGGRFTLDRRLDPIWRASLTTRLEDVNVKNIPNFASEAITRDRGHSFVLGLRGGLTRDTRDSFLFPTAGSIVDFGYEQVFGTNNFPIGTVEATKFFSSDYLRRQDGSGKHVLAFRSQASFTSSDAPIYERFFAGGFRSFRGFSFRGVGPVENQLHIGGTFALLNTIEYQIPLNAKDSLFFVTFLDHGTVERSTTIKDYRASAGFGFRVQIPALGPVPVAFDFAFPLNRTPGDNTQVFAFYVGLFGGQ